MRFFPRAMIQASQALVSLRRLDAYMTTEELDDYAVAHDAAAARGWCGWKTACTCSRGRTTTTTERDSSTRRRCTGIDLEARAGELVAVVSGKSSLLGCILGEMRKGLRRGDGALKDKTAVLVTHQVEFLHNADAIYDGMIVQSASTVTTSSKVLSSRRSWMPVTPPWLSWRPQQQHQGSRRTTHSRAPKEQSLLRRRRRRSLAATAGKRLVKGRGTHDVGLVGACDYWLAYGTSSSGENALRQGALILISCRNLWCGCE
ncbi:hypothetical protein EJB05_15197, partial [Eragrostis curvula]